MPQKLSPPSPLCLVICVTTVLSLETEDELIVPCISMYLIHMEIPWGTFPSLSYQSVKVYLPYFQASPTLRKHPFHHPDHSHRHHNILITLPTTIKNDYKVLFCRLGHVWSRQRKFVKSGMWNTPQRRTTRQTVRFFP